MNKEEKITKEDIEDLHEIIMMFKYPMKKEGDNSMIEWHLITDELFEILFDNYEMGTVVDFVTEFSTKVILWTLIEMDMIEEENFETCTLITEIKKKIKELYFTGIMDMYHFNGILLPDDKEIKDIFNILDKVETESFEISKTKYYENN